MIKAVFFDIGNTLFFYDYEFLSKFLTERFAIDRDARELEAVHFSLIEMASQRFNSNGNHSSIVAEVYRRWFEDLDIDEERIPSILEAIGTHPFPHLFWGRLGEGVREMLEWFRGHGYKMGVISNAEGQIRNLLTHTRIVDYFSIVLDSKEVGLEKPDARIFLKAVGDAGVKPNEAVYIGDLVEVDVMGSQRAGMVPVLVDRDGRHANVKCLRVRKVKDVITLPLFNK